MRQEAVREFAPHIEGAAARSVDLSQPLRLRQGSMTITPEMAAKILAENLFSGQRSQKAGIIQALADEMKRGWFTPGMQLHFGRVNGVPYLVNGQQRLNAVVKAEVPIEFNIHITECENEAELASLYWRHDTVASPRTVSDVLRASGRASEEGMGASDAARFIAAVKSIHVGIYKNSGATGSFQSAPELKSPDRVFEIARTWWRYGRQYLECTGHGSPFNQTLFKRRAIFAVGLITLKHQNERAAEFWRAASEDDRLARTDPRKKLLEFLIQNPANTNNNIALVRACSLAWNAWFEGRTITYLKANADFEISFAGTPIGRKKKGGK